MGQCHIDVLSVLAHRPHEPHEAENLPHVAAEKGTGAVREWIGQIIMMTMKISVKTLLILTSNKTPSDATGYLSYDVT